MIDRYLKRFARWTVGTPEHRRWLRAELEAHLVEAQRAGGLDDALARLGTPREAAAAFSRGSPLHPAPLAERFAAAAFDALTVAGPMWLAYSLNQYIVPYTIVGILMITGYVWWGIGLTVIEWLTGRTPGKALAGLRVVTEDGTAPSLAQVALRRATLFFLMAPFGLIDCAFALRNPE